MALIDEVAIYDRVLDASEIQATVAAGGAGKCKALEVGIELTPENADNAVDPFNAEEHGQG